MADPVQYRMDHTTKDDVHDVYTVKPAHGRPIIAESVKTADPRKQEHFEQDLFPKLMTPEMHKERARVLYDQAEHYRAEGNPKKYNDLMGQAKYHEAMAIQPHPLESDLVPRQPSPNAQPL